MLMNVDILDLFHFSGEEARHKYDEDLYPSAYQQLMDATQLWLLGVCQEARDDC